MRCLITIFILVNSIVYAQSNRGVIINVDQSKSIGSGKYHAIIISENNYLD